MAYGIISIAVVAESVDAAVMALTLLGEIGRNLGQAYGRSRRLDRTYKMQVQVLPTAP